MKDLCAPNQKGVTLTQLAAVLLITGILAAAAYPVYISYVQSARISAVRSALLENARFMERVYRQKGSFKVNSTTWPQLPVTQVEGYCIRLSGIARGATGETFTLKAVSSNGAKPAVVRMNPALNTVVCEQTLSDCSDAMAVFKGNDKQCRALGR